MRITKSTLLNGAECQFGDFNVFIGGNGVGKTTLLLELHAKSAGLSRAKYVWISEPKYHSNHVNDDLALIKSSLSRKYEGTNLFYYSRAAKNANGDIDLANELRFSDAEHTELSEPKDLSVFDTMKYRRPFVALSSCDARLGLSDSVEITGLDQPPQDPINVLYRNRKILAEIDKTISDRFKFNLALLDHTKRQLHIGLAREPAPIFDSTAANAQDEYEKIERWRVEKFTPLSESGHGIRSMIRLLTSLLEPVNKVIMIDEPEIHLYPSQKRWLGRQLVRLAKDQGKQVFLVTHDPMILQGILDANTTTSIFRIERSETNLGSIQSCALQQFEDINATRNQDQYLQGLFYQRCIVVEGASDRSFYQCMVDQFPETADKDLGFVASGGKASSKHMAVLASKVGLKCAFIFDLDVIFFQSAVIQEIFALLGGTTEPLKKLNEVLEEGVRAKNPQDEKQRNAAIKQFTGYKDKSGVSDDWKRLHGSIFDEAIGMLASVGIFCVPRGSLESWAPEVEPKVRFSELAPVAVFGNAELKVPLDRFLTDVLEHLEIHQMVQAGAGQ